MNEFSFSVVPDVLVGAETSQRLGDITAAMGMQRVLIVTDPGIVQLGLLDGAIKNLESNHVTLSIYSDVVADPPESVVTDAVVAAQEFGCDGVIGFGGISGKSQ